MHEFFLRFLRVDWKITWIPLVRLRMLRPEISTSLNADRLDGLLGFGCFLNNTLFKSLFSWKLSHVTFLVSSLILCHRQYYVDKNKSTAQGIHKAFPLLMYLNVDKRCGRIWNRLTILNKCLFALFPTGGPVRSCPRHVDDGPSHVYRSRCREEAGWARDRRDWLHEESDG